MNASIVRIYRQKQRSCLWPLSAFPSHYTCGTKNKKWASSAPAQSLFQSSEYYYQSTLTRTGDSIPVSRKKPMHQNQQKQHNHHCPPSSTNIHITKDRVSTNTSIEPVTQSQNKNDMHQGALSSSSSSSSSLQNESHFDTLFTIDLPEGKCVGLEFSSSKYHKSLCSSQITSTEDHWIKQMLHPEEVQYGIDLPSETARLTFFIGRLAMRTALTLSAAANNNNSLVADTHVHGESDAKAQLGEGMEMAMGIEMGTDGQLSDISVACEDRKFGGFVQLPVVNQMDPSILKDQYGRPQVPKGYIGSISHKKTTGVALVNCLPIVSEDDNSSPSSPPSLRPRIGIGVDIEQTFSPRRSIAKKILTKNELEHLGKLNGVTVDEEVLLRFSLKECVYKAMHPLISQWVGFQEAEIHPHEDGTATVTLNLKSGAHEQFDTIQAHWRRVEGGYFLTSSKVTLKD
eukprot:CAMPEP_0203673686 /NCGR_PEP_ID=MMETSP0090-20130426/13549_1 /ASSEMBLY_ACC=CAM_ASM_001088 /TAXON_ID=426623 /ORGANISM="Chaetoceros affinis, Strain CCMP159" /LENGTH=456 /DNA_ID=CAMNT_0050539391 /DNA_START=434 /DNA_END=1804 /DNA_ORIENTATION=+